MKLFEIRFLRLSLLLIYQFRKQYIQLLYLCQLHYLRLEKFLLIDQFHLIYVVLLSQQNRLLLHLNLSDLLIISQRIRMDHRRKLLEVLLAYLMKMEDYCSLFLLRIELTQL
jgi:hypothetical protein